MWVGQLPFFYVWIKVHLLTYCPKEGQTMKKEVISVMQRYELKYILSKEQAASFTNEILKHMNIDEYGLNGC